MDRGARRARRAGGVGEQVDQWTGRTQSPASTLVLVFGVLVRAAAVVALPPSAWLLVLLATAVVGRWAAVFLQSIGDAIEPDESQRSLVAAPAPAWLIGALSLGVLVLTILAVGKVGIVALALAALIAFGLGLAAQRREGGLTPPVVACAAAVGEVLLLLVASTGHR